MSPSRTEVVPLPRHPASGDTASCASRKLQFSAGQTRTVAYGTVVGREDAYGFRVFVYALAAGKKSTGRVDRATISVHAASLLKFCAITDIYPRDAFAVAAL